MDPQFNVNFHQKVLVSGIDAESWPRISSLTLTVCTECRSVDSSEGKRDAKVEQSKRRLRQKRRV